MRAADGREIVIRNIIWDVDGTLFDTYPAIARAFRAALNDLGQDAALHRIERLARRSLGECAATLAAQCRVDRARLEARVAEHYERTPPEEQPLFPGAREICDRIWFGGGQNVIVTHRGARGTAELLAANGLSRYFAGCITRNDGLPRKPDPAAFTAAIERYGLDRGATLAIGDRDIDVVAGRAAGVFTCFFGAPPDGLEADLVIADFAQLAVALGIDAPLGVGPNR
jgi:phosphoglycolate phosphatase-like HAD superfamily hydrolase